jgi:hypothetical protein
MKHEASAGSRETADRGSLLALSDEMGGVPVVEPRRVELTGVLARDVLALSGLTASELARAVGRSERAVRHWLAAGENPESVEMALRQLRTIALRLVGGFGPAGVHRWLTAGEPSPLELISRGDAARALADTDRLLDSPAS